MVRCELTCARLVELMWQNHNIHHLVPNELEHDPDIQHIPFFAISKQFFGSLWSSYYKRIMEFDAASKALIAFQWVYSKGLH